jgi:hypothetical protein
MKIATPALVASLVALSLVPIPSPAEPPPHAYVGYTGKKWPNDYGVAQGSCNVSGPEDRPVAIMLGTAIGTGIDRACMGHALELAGERKSVAWTNPATGVSYRLTPAGAFKDGGMPCRRFTTVLALGKKKDIVKGAACRQSSGEWVFRST